MVRYMKTHLPVLLRSLLLAAMMEVAPAALTWNSGQWNLTEASWLEAGNPAVFANGDAVEFTAAAQDTMVTISEVVEPESVVISSGTYTFAGTGSIGGSTALLLSGDSAVTIDNANTFTGGTTIDAGASLRLALFNGVGTTNAGEFALGSISGSGMLELAMLNASTQVSIRGNSLAGFTGTLYVEQGNVGLGRRSNHSGAGTPAYLGAKDVLLGSSGSFIISYGGGQASLMTGNQFQSDVRTESGAVLGNRDGHVNWSGIVSLNEQDVLASQALYDSTGRTELSLYYGKYVVWDGVVYGSGVLELTSGSADIGNDHRLVLTNEANEFNGTYRIAANYLTTLALASPQSAAAASVELGSAQSRLMLMGSDAAITSLNGSAGTVLAAGNRACLLTVQDGTFSGNVQDSASTPPVGLSLGIVKVGSGTLNLIGTNCQYTGATQVQGGSLVFAGDVTLGDVNVVSGATLQVEGNLSLQAASALQLSVEGSTSCAALVMDGSLHALDVSDYENLLTGSYDLLTWQNASSVSAESFSPQGLNATVDKYYAVQVNGNALQLVVSSMSDVPWLWSGGSATWSDDSSAEWSNAGSSLPAGQSVSFGPQNAGVVTIDRVTPSAVQVMGGEYSFVASDAASEGIVSSGPLSISGDDTVLNLNLQNESFTGNVNLQGGVLVLGNTQALPQATFSFNGGMVQYGVDITTDISSQLQSGATGPVRIDSNGNEVSWSNSDGVKQSLQLGVEKNGAGSLQLNWVGAGETMAGTLVVNNGTLVLSKSSGGSTLAGGYSGSGNLTLSSPAGQLTVQGDSTSFSGTVNLTGDGAAGTGSVCFGSGGALGGSNTLVKVAGQRFWFASNTSTAANFEIMDDSTTYFDGSTGSRYVFTGSVSGGGALILKPSCSMVMSGDVSGFEGVFQHPGTSNVTWLLGGQGVAGAGNLQAELSATSGNMVYQIWYESPTTMSGAVTGAAQLRQSGSGVLSLTGQNTTTGALTVDEGCEVALGTAEASGSWAGGTLNGSGQLRLVNGTLGQPLSPASAVMLADVATGGGVDMGGTAGNQLQSIRIDTGGRLSGITGNLDIGANDGPQALVLSFAAANVGSTSELAPGKQAMIYQENGVLNVYDAIFVTIDNEAIKTIIQGQRQAVYLHVSNSDIQLQNGVTAAGLFANSATTPEALGLTVLGVDKGNIVLEGAVVDVYMVTENGDYPTVTSYTKLQDYKATYVDAGYTLSLQLPGDNAQEAWVNNLLGAGNLSVSNTDAASGLVRVLLNNAVLGNIDSNLTPEQEASINTANTLLEGTVTAGSAVQLVKTGSGTLTIGGVLYTPWLEVDEGTLRLQASGNAVESLHGDASLALENGSSLEISGNSLAFAGQLSGAGELVLNGSLPGRGIVGALSGQGSLQSAGQTFALGNVQDATFSGSLTGDAATPAVLSIEAGGGTFTMAGVQGSAAWSVQNQGKLVLMQAGQSSNEVLTLGGLDLQSGSASILVWNSDWNNEILNLGELTVADDASLTLQSTASTPVSLRPDGTLVLGLVQNAELGGDERAELVLGSGAAFRGIDSAWLTVENGELVLHTLMSQVNPYEEVADSPNARTGASLLWNPPAAVLADSPDVAALTDAIDRLIDAGENAAASDLMAAAAGAGMAVLATAVSGDMERQLKSIRNRTIAMGLDPDFKHDDLPLFHAWVNAEGDHQELEADGTDSGYTLSSWGATVGFDVNVSSAATAGLAFTAMYGDWEGRSFGDTSGDVMHYYLSAFGKYTHGRWNHTLVGAIGLADWDLKRHVYYGTGSYRTKGSTDGFSLGLLYELSYDIPLQTVSPALLQPLFNISYRHAEVDGYREHGSDAALRMGQQDMDVLTFGLGVRVQTTALESIYNRSCPVESRFLVKVDAGDTRSHGSVSMLAMPERSGRIRSAESHRTGLEMGIGISIPIGAEGGFLFMDCSYECRFDASEVNGTVGYRLSF